LMKMAKHWQVISDSLPRNPRPAFPPALIATFVPSGAIRIPSRL
jgi:hypothetical protein